MPEDKRFLLDGQPVTVAELIAEGEAINAEFASDWLKTTSRAAAILRDDGAEVSENPA